MIGHRIFISILFLLSFNISAMYNRKSSDVKNKKRTTTQLNELTVQEEKPLAVQQPPSPDNAQTILLQPTPTQQASSTPPVYVLPVVHIPIPATQPPQVINNVTTTQISKNENTTETTATADAQATLKASFTNDLKNILTHAPEDVEGCLNIYGWHIVAGTAVATPTLLYCIVCIWLQRGNKIINNPATWARWKRHLSIEELHSSCINDHEKQKLTHNLINNILKQYFTVKEPTNHIDPLIKFMTRVNNEMSIINRYILIGTILQKSRLITLFPTNDAKIAQAKECRQRLQCVKQLFINSMANHNLNQFLRSTTPVPPPSPLVAAAYAAPITNIPLVMAAPAA